MTHKKKPYIDLSQRSRKSSTTFASITCMIGLSVVANSAIVTAVNSTAWTVGSTWNTGSPPGSGDSVVIPAGKTVRFTSGSPVTIQDLTIQGVLTITPNGTRSLSTNWVMVNGGKIVAGSSATAFVGSFVLTLEGDFPDATNGGIVKQDAFLMTMDGGGLNLFGTPKTPYQKLLYIAEVGSTQIRLRDGAIDGWQVGDVIAITSSSLNPNEVDVRTITAIDESAFGTQVNLNLPLTYRHHGAGRHSEKYTEGSRLWFVDEAAEVANLTRNIQIRGDANSVSDGIGGNMMFMGGSDIQLQGVSMYRMGQKKKMGRYPIHWHRGGNATGNFVRNCAIEDSYNRAITVHGTQNVSIENNVAYNHVGHGLFLEDAVETGCIIRGNIMFGTKRPAIADALIPTDVRPFTPERFAAPGTYWITHPDNIVENNVAAGGDGIGFWYAHPDGPLGDSKSDPAYANVSPQNGRLGGFSGNSMHSYRSGLVSDEGPDVVTGEPMTVSYSPTNTGLANGTPIRETFRNFIVSHTDFSGEYLRGNRSDIDNAVFADNRLSSFNTYSAVVSNSLFIAKSNLNPVSGKTASLVFYDGPHEYHNCHFMKFDNLNSPIFAKTDATRKFVPHIFSGTTMDSSTRAYGLKLVGKDGKRIFFR